MARRLRGGWKPFALAFNAEGGDSNCGTGAGGFQPGNRCARGGAGEATPKGGGSKSRRERLIAGLAAALKVLYAGARKQWNKLARGKDEDWQPSNIEVDYFSGVKEELATLFPDVKFTPGLVGALASAPSGTRVTVRSASRFDRTGVAFSCNDAGVSTERVLWRGHGYPADEVEAKASHFVIDDKSSHKGKGTDLFYSTAKALSQLGVKQLQTYAAGYGGDTGPGTYNGYHTWPRLGYNGTLPLSKVNELNWYDEMKPIVGKLPKNPTILDLYETEEGRKWWQKHGTSLSLIFDLRPNSRSWRVLNAYRAYRATQGYRPTKG